jgi:hypothetical protein
MLLVREIFLAQVGIIFSKLFFGHGSLLTLVRSWAYAWTSVISRFSHNCLMTTWLTPSPELHILRNQTRHRSLTLRNKQSSMRAFVDSYHETTYLRILQVIWYKLLPKEESNVYGRWVNTRPAISIVPVIVTNDHELNSCHVSDIALSALHLISLIFDRQTMFYISEVWHDVLIYACNVARVNHAN